MNIYCCKCKHDVDARLTSGTEIYPHREDLHTLPFWVCDACKNFVGCHHKTQNPTTPLGCIPTAEIKAIRQEIHKLIDPIWKDGGVPRAKVYGTLSKLIGKTYHTGEIRTEDEGMRILGLAKTLTTNFRRRR